MTGVTGACAAGVVAGLVDGVWILAVAGDCCPGCRPASGFSCAVCGTAAVFCGLLAAAGAGAVGGVAVAGVDCVGLAAADAEGFRSDFFFC